MRATRLAAAALAISTLTTSTLVAPPAFAEDPLPGVRVELVTSPEALPTRHDRPRLFLGGSIDMGNARDWQAEMIAALRDTNLVILNPRRADWNPAWQPVASDPNFRQQVEWELSALDSADIIVIVFTPGSQSPVSLLEMGLHARAGRMVIYCPEGYWRKGNVDITAAHYGIETVDSMDALIAAVRRRANAWVAQPPAP